MPRHYLETAHNPLPLDLVVETAIGDEVATSCCFSFQLSTVARIWGSIKTTATQSNWISWCDVSSYLRELGLENPEARIAEVGGIMAL